MEEFSECCKNNIREVSKIDNEGLKEFYVCCLLSLFVALFLLFFQRNLMLVIVLTYQQKRLFKNDVVFEGQVIEVGRKEGGGIEVLFEVKKIWKGTNSFANYCIYKWW